MDWAAVLPQIELSPLRVGFLLWAGTIGIFDWRQHRIPNVLLLLVLVPAVLTLTINTTGLLGASRLSSVTGLLIGFGLFIPGYLAGVSGAGDVKLSAICGLLLGQASMIEAGLYSGLGLLIFALVLLQRYGWAHARGMRFPAGVAIAAGFSVAMLVPHVFF